MVNEFAKTRERDRGGKFIIPTIASKFDRDLYQKEYYLKNREKKIKISVEWGRNNKDKRKIYKDKWRAKNRLRTNFLARRYIYRKKNAEGKMDYDYVKNLYGKNCAYCHSKKADTVDHILSLTRGGTNDNWNLLPSCVSCNSKKGSKTLFEWRPIDSMNWVKIFGSKITYGK